MLPSYNVGAKREPPLLSNIIIMVGSCVHSESNAIIIVKNHKELYYVIQDYQGLL